MSPFEENRGMSDGFISSPLFWFKPLNFNDTYLLASQLRFKEADNIISQNYKFKEMQYVKVYQYFIKILIADDADSETNFYNAIGSYEKSKYKNLEKIYYDYFDAQILLFKCVIAGKKQKYIDAGIQFKKAYTAHENIIRSNKDFAPSLLSFGIMHSIVATTPAKYASIVKFVGMKGNFKTAMEEINTATGLANKKGEYNFLMYDALLLKTLVEVNLFKHKSQILETRNELLKQKNKSPLLIYALYKSYDFTWQNDSCIDVLKKAPKESIYEPFCYLDYLMGSCKLNRLDSDAAIYFASYLKKYPGKDYKQATNLKLAWCALIQNDTEGVNKIIKQIKTGAASLLEEDKKATKEIKYIKNTNANLLRARLLFDGGYYVKAYQELDLKNAKDLYTTFYEKMEMTYRLGRIYHKQNNYKKAIEYYEVVIKGYGNSEYYFAANSALMTAEIYEAEKDLVNAEKYYKLSISFKGHDYENSIEQKAKAGLSRIGKD